METQSWDDASATNAFREVYDVNTGGDGDNNNNGYNRGYNNGYHQGGGGRSHRQYHNYNGNGNGNGYRGGNGYSNNHNYRQSGYNDYNQYNNGNNNGYHYHGNDQRQMQHNDHYQSGYNVRNNNRGQRHYNRQRGRFKENRSNRGKGRRRGNNKQYNHRNKRNQYQRRQYQSKGNRFDAPSQSNHNDNGNGNVVNEESNEIDDIQRDVDTLHLEQKEDPNDTLNGNHNASDHHPTPSPEPSQLSRPTRVRDNRFGSRKKKKNRRVIEDNLNFNGNDDEEENERDHVDHGRRTRYVDESEPQMYTASYPQNGRSFQHNGNRNGSAMNGHHQTQNAVKSQRKHSRNAHDYEMRDLSDRARKMALQLKSGKYDCAVCQSFVGKKARIWKCGHCFAIFHMNCINEWARAKEKQDAQADQRRPRSDRALTELRCPACNFVDKKFKFNQYECFCGQHIFDHEHRSAYSVASNIPHSCGEICGKKRGESCPHPCPAVCHPGPCEPCNLPSDRTSTCACGKMTFNLKCGEDDKVQRLCGQICDKLLKCGNHRCKRKCHEGPCDECTMKVKQECFCGSHTAMKPCGSGTKMTIIVEDYKERADDSNSDMDIDDGNDDEEKEAEEGKTRRNTREVTVWKYSCKNICGKVLSCGNHKCTLTCHSGSCSGCPRRIEEVTRCACGKTTFPTITRKSCLDPLPTCGKKCGRMLKCGEHFCNEKCHDGPCKPCSVVVKKKCRCGGSERRMSCDEFSKKSKQFLKSNPEAAIMEGADSWIRCKTKCKRVKTCGKHKCKTTCCKGRGQSFYEGHICREICNKPLGCGRHRCTSFCHRGKCNPCGVTYRNGVECACGNVFVPGPFQCGTKPIPKCTATCDKVLECGHRCAAQCHHGNCPPCIRICSKPCHSHQRMVHNMPCHVNNRSCGNPCGKLLSCGVHKCLKTCHAGRCESKREMARGCDQTCNLELDCGHRCAQKCHVKKGDCSMFVCMAPITVQCKCGSNVEKQYCRGRMKYEIEPVQCTEQCKILRRNARFREALNISNKKQKKDGSGDNDDDRIRIPFAATVLRRILKWMKTDKGHSTFIKEQQKVYSPKFVQYLEGILDAFLSDKTDTAKQFKSLYPDIRPFINASTMKWTGTISLKPMNAEQRYITYCMVTAYHIKAEKVEQNRSPSYIELTKTKHSMIPDYLLSTALVEYQLHSNEMDTLESMPPSSIIVIDNSEEISSSSVQDRLMAWAGDYRMYRDGNEQLYIVFTDENARNSAMTEMRKIGGRKATKADSLDASAVQKKSEEKKQKKALSKAQSKASSKAKANGWTMMGDVSPKKMPKKQSEKLNLKMGGRF